MYVCNIDMGILLHTYIYIYISLSLSVFLSLYTCVFTYLHIITYTYTYIYIYIYYALQMHVCVCNVHTCVCTKVCVYVYVMSISAAVCGLLVCLAVCESVIYRNTGTCKRGAGREGCCACTCRWVYIHTYKHADKYVHACWSFCSVT